MKFYQRKKSDIAHMLVKIAIVINLQIYNVYIIYYILYMYIQILYIYISSHKIIVSYPCLKR